MSDSDTSRKKEEPLVPATSVLFAHDTSAQFIISICVDIDAKISTITLRIMYCRVPRLATAAGRFPTESVP